MAEKIETEKDPKIQEAREHMREARRAMKSAWETLLPKGLLENRRKARKEMLLALRSMVDAAVEKVEDKK